MARRTAPGRTTRPAAAGNRGRKAAPARANRRAPARGGARNRRAAPKAAARGSNT